MQVSGHPLHMDSDDAAAGAAAAHHPPWKKQKTINPTHLVKGVEIPSRGKGANAKGFLAMNDRDAGKQMKLSFLQPKLQLELPNGKVSIPWLSSITTAAANCLYS